MKSFALTFLTVLRIQQLSKRSLIGSVVFSAVLLTVITSIVLGRPHRTPTDLPPVNVDRAPDVDGDESETQSLLIEVRPYGFISSELTVPAGKYLIALNNRSGRPDLTFSIDRQSEGRVSQSKAKQRDWTQQIVLRPGTYILSEANNPTWRCAIRVTDR